MNLANGSCQKQTTGQILINIIYMMYISIVSTLSILLFQTKKKYLLFIIGVCEQEWMDTRTKQRKSIHPYCNKVNNLSTIVLILLVSVKYAIYIKKITRYLMCTVCPRSSDPFYIVSNYIKLVTTSWTYSILNIFFWRVTTSWTYSNSIA